MIKKKIITAVLSVSTVLLISCTVDTCKGFIMPKNNNQLVVEAETESSTAETTETKTVAKQKKKSLIPEKYKKLSVINTEEETTVANDDDEIVEVYSKESIGSNEAGVAVKGCNVKVLSKNDKWVKIKSGKVAGYVEKKNVVTGKKALKVLMESEHIQAKIKNKNTDIKSDKTKKAKKISVAQKDKTYSVQEISKDEKWVKVKKTDKVSGWIKAETIKLKVDKENVYTSEEYDDMLDAEWKQKVITYTLDDVNLKDDGSEAAKLIKYASKFLGNRYVWGGTSLTHGADCSGFVRSLFRKFGYNLNRTAAEQAGNGKSISHNKIKPGDLLFYHTDRRNKNRISHVAIYIGDGKIIHAANRKAGIIISGMGNPCAARRILTGKNNEKTENKKHKEKKKNNQKEITTTAQKETETEVQTVIQNETKKQETTTVSGTETTIQTTKEDE